MENTIMFNEMTLEDVMTVEGGNIGEYISGFLYGLIHG